MPDVVVIGAGVVGLTTAWELAGRGFSVRVLDQSVPGREASWAGAGILPPGYPGNPAEPLPRLTALSNQHWWAVTEKLREETGIDNGLRRCGGIELGEGTSGSLRKEMSGWIETGARVEPLRSAEITRLEPAMSAALPEGYRLPDLHQVRNPWHLRALLQACAQRGVEVVGSERVVSWNRQGSRVASVVSERGVHAAGSFVLSAGAWSNDLAEPLGGQLEIVPIRGQIVLLNAPEIALRHVIECGPRYVVPREDGHILIGSTEENVGFVKENTPPAVEELLRFGAELVPAIREARVEKTWAGLRPHARRGRPWIGPSKTWENVLLATGHFRAGLHLSPATARLLAQHLCGEPTDLPLDLFGPDPGE